MRWEVRAPTIRLTTHKRERYRERSATGRAGMSMGRGHRVKAVNWRKTSLMGGGGARWMVCHASQGRGRVGARELIPQGTGADEPAEQQGRRGFGELAFVHLQMLE